MKKYLCALLCALLLLLTACGDTPAPSAEDGSYYKAVFDTSQDAGKLTARYLLLTEDYGTGDDRVTTGDSTVYTSPDGRVMLVDCGNQNGGKEVVAQLQAMGVEKIDILVFSHPHADHVGGFAAVAEAFEIGQIYMNAHEYETATYANVLALIEQKNIPSTCLWEGDSFAFGAQVQVQVFGPTQDDIDQIQAGYMDANNSSLAMRLSYGDSSFWSSGDLYVPKETALVEQYGAQIDSDVMKMDHHGWDTSNSAAFVEAVSPLIAVGMHDSITSKTVALRYSTRGVLTFYNCLDGAVRVSTTGDGTYDVQSQLVRDVVYYGEPAADGHYSVG